MLTPIPYVGEISFLLYLLLHRLEHRLPTAVQLNSEYYFIFDEQGATVHLIDDGDEPRLERCWALVGDVDPALGWAERVILITSLKLEKWERWLTVSRGTWIVMDLPSVPEIAAILSVGMVPLCLVRMLMKHLYRKELDYNISSTLFCAQVWTINSANPPPHGGRSQARHRSH